MDDSVSFSTNWNASEGGLDGRLMEMSSVKNVKALNRLVLVKCEERRKL